MILNLFLCFSTKIFFFYYTVASVIILDQEPPSIIRTCLFFKFALVTTISLTLGVCWLMKLASYLKAALFVSGKVQTRFDKVVSEINKYLNNIEVSLCLFQLSFISPLIPPLMVLTAIAACCGFEPSGVPEYLDVTFPAELPAFQEGGENMNNEMDAYQKPRPKHWYEKTMWQLVVPFVVLTALWRFPY